MIITKDLIENFKNHLVEEEKSQATFEKYIRDVTAFYVWLAGREVEKTQFFGIKNIYQKTMPLLLLILFCHH